MSRRSQGKPQTRRGEPAGAPRRAEPGAAVPQHRSRTASAGFVLLLFLPVWILTGMVNVMIPAAILGVSCALALWSLFRSNVSVADRRLAMATIVIAVNLAVLGAAIGRAGL